MTSATSIPIWQVLHEFGKPAVDGLADAHDVRSRAIGDGHTDRWKPVEAHQLARRVGIAFGDLADVAQLDHLFRGPLVTLAHGPNQIDGIQIVRW